jgi:hypothetical protein
MRRNGKPKKLPTHIALRTDELAPLLAQWKKRYPNGQWAVLLTRGLKRELAAVATKRTRHLLDAAGDLTDGRLSLSRETELVDARLARLPHHIQVDIMTNPTGMNAMKFAVMCALEWDAVWEKAS